MTTQEPATPELVIHSSHAGWDRISRPSVHSLWMANCFLTVISWWIGCWDLRNITQWPVLMILSLLAGAIGLFLAAAFVCPRLPSAGNVDLWQFHIQNRQKHLIPLLSAMLIGTVATLYYGDVEKVHNQNLQAGAFCFHDSRGGLLHFCGRMRRSNG